MNAADGQALKEQGMQASLWGMPDVVWCNFVAVISTMPKTFSSNEARGPMTTLLIDAKLMGGLFNRAIKCGLIEPKMTSDGPPWRVPSTDPKTHRAYVAVYVNNFGRGWTA